MRLFGVRRPRGFRHTYIFRSSSRSMTPEASGKFRGRWNKRPVSERRVVSWPRLILLAVLLYLLYYILNGSGPFYKLHL